MKKLRRTVLSVVLILLLLCSVIMGISLVKIQKNVKQVMQWESLVKETTAKYGMEDHSDLVLSIIYTESRGAHVDLMQSSESRYGISNQITTSEESIDSGVEHLSQVMKEASEQGCDKWTAVQAYNYGANYIDYVKGHGGKHTLALSEAYSKDYLAPVLGNTDKDTYFYKAPRAIFYNGGKLYKNGGNLFYADHVKWHLKLIQWFK